MVFVHCVLSGRGIVPTILLSGLRANARTSRSIFAGRKGHHFVIRGSTLSVTLAWLTPSALIRSGFLKPNQSNLIEANGSILRRLVSNVDWYGVPIRWFSSGRTRSIPWYGVPHREPAQDLGMGHPITVRATSRVVTIDPKARGFEVDAWDGDPRIGDGHPSPRHRECDGVREAFGVKTLTMSSD